MRVFASVATGLAGAGLVSAVSRYAANQVPFVKVPDGVMAKLPDVDTEILSPAFLDPESVSEAFANSTDGPTTQFAMGTCTGIMAWRTPDTDRPCQKPSCRRWQPATSG